MIWIHKSIALPKASLWEWSINGMVISRSSSGKIPFSLLHIRYMLYIRGQHDSICLFKAMLLMRFISRNHVKLNYKQMSLKKITCSISLVLTFGLNSFAQTLSNKEKLIFDDVAYAVDSTGNAKITKWVVPIRYQIKGEEIPQVIKEIDTTFAQIKLLTGLDIKKAQNDTEANLIIELGKSDPTKNVKTSIGGKFMLTGDNMSTINDKSEIIRVENRFFNDIYPTKADSKYQITRMILRSIGFFKRSYEDPYSIFYSRTNNTIKIGKSDARIVQALYHPNIKSGMLKLQVDAIFPID